MERDKADKPSGPSIGHVPAALIVVAAATVVGALWWRTTRFVPDDAYFYLVVARNLARTGAQTFSGLFDTDGVQPLWTWVAAALTWFLDRVDSSWAASPRAFLAVHHVALAASGLLLASTARAVGVSLWLAVTVPLTVVASVPILHTEAPLSLLSLALLVRSWVALPRSLATAMAVGAAAALTVLARLDHAFVAIALLVGWHVRSGNPLMAGAAWVTAGLPVGVWLLWHHRAFGAWVPVAGLLKSTLPAVCPSGVHVGGIASALSGWNLAAGWLPLAVMVAALMASRRAPSSNLRSLVGALTAGTLGHAVQVGLFTHHPASWLWYYVAPVVGATWALALALRHRPALAMWMAASCATVGATYAAWVAVRPWQQLDALRAVAALDAHGVSDATLLVSDGPGEIAYRTNNRVIALDLLTTNPRLVAAVHAAADPIGPLLDAARAAGHPVSHVVHTSGTWLTSTRIVEDAAALQVAFLRPGVCRGRKLGRLKLGAPLVHQPELTVWRLNSLPPP